MENLNRRCSRCGRDAVIELRYEGKFLCERCFTRLFEKRVRRTIRINGLLKRNDKTAVALSGGKDSATTLYILKKLSDRIKSEVIAITIEQGNNEYWKKCLEAARNICNELGVEIHEYSFKEEFGITLDEIVKMSKSIPNPAPPCTYCGVLRRRLLNDKARILGVTKIATGHNLDDEIQASLMNFIRGELNRIARMGPVVGILRDKKFIPRIKPLRECPENEVERYAEIRGLKFLGERCPYSKDAFRQTIREIINKIEENHPGSKFQILRSTDQLIQILRSGINSKEIRRCEKCNEPSSGEICKFCQIREEFGF